MANYIADYQMLPEEFEKTPEKKLKIPKEAVPGDVIAYSTYRDTGSYFLGWDGKLIGNPDLSEMGYLTIPLSVTKHFKNAVKYYSNYHFDEIPITFVLSGKDQWVVRKYGRALPKGWIVTYWKGEGQNSQIDITFPNGIKETFDIFATYKEIKSYYDKIDEPRFKYRIDETVSYSDIRSWQRYRDSRDIGLPPTCKLVEKTSSLDKLKEETDYVLYGPESDRKEALDILTKFYNDSGINGVKFKYKLKKPKSKSD